MKYFYVSNEYFSLNETSYYIMNFNSR